MKQSRYNHFIPLDGETYLLNGLTEKFFSVPAGREETYRELLDNPDLYADDFAVFYKKMRDGGFILEDETDEMQLVREKFELLRKPSEYSLMVLPTYACNLRCWYCVQDHQNVNLTDDLFERLKKHIDKVVKKDDIKSFKLWWFGGEPLIQYDKVLALNLHAKKRCEENGLVFSANITTNSTLLTPERVDALRESGVNHYQISIDGPKKLHDKVKVLQGRSAFDHALSIIDYIARTTNVTLRFNYTKDTLLPDEVFHDIDTRLSEESRKNISFLIYKVWQEADSAIDQDKLMRLYASSKEKMLHPELPTAGICYADQKYFFCVYPNGKVGKCDNHAITSGAGELTLDGDIIWPNGLIYDVPVMMSSDNGCRDCRNLPLCWGPCPSKRENAVSKKEAYKCIFPTQQGKERMLRDFLRRFLEMG